MYVVLRIMVGVEMRVINSQFLLTIELIFVNNLNITKKMKSSINLKKIKEMHINKYQLIK